MDDGHWRSHPRLPQPLKIFRRELIYEYEIFEWQSLENESRCFYICLSANRPGFRAADSRGRDVASFGGHYQTGRERAGECGYSRDGGRRSSRCSYETELCTPVEPGRCTYPDRVRR